MSNLETALLDALLDRYERSRGFKENRSQRRRVDVAPAIDLHQFQLNAALGGQSPQRPVNRIMFHRSGEHMPAPGIEIPPQGQVEAHRRPGCKHDTAGVRGVDQPGQLSPDLFHQVRRMAG